MKTYDLEKLKKLLKDFYNLTNIKICIYDNNENELCYYPEKLNPFCKLLREDGEMDARCKSCDKRAFSECKKTHKQYLYTCHAGLTECVSPILYKDNIIGYVIIGQIKESSKFSMPSISKTTTQLIDEFNKLPEISRDKINSAVNIMDACTGYEYLKNLMASIENDIQTRISNFISNNIKGDLTVATLCSEFNLSNSEVYNIFKTYFGMTPAEYIKNYRLKEAYQLLESTRLAVNKVAVKVGIPDYNYFSKIFKKHFSISPRQLRAMTKAKNNKTT